MRITGLATGMDIDNVIKESMKPYRVKIDQTTQKKDVVEIKQKLYRDIIKESRDFFDKYLDIGKSDSLLKTSNWSAVSFSSSDENAVTAKANGGAIKDNYTVSVEQLAAKATAVVKMDDIKLGKSISIDGTPLIDSITDDQLKTPSLLVDRINKVLSDNKKDIIVKYSEISGGLVFESKEIGSKVGDKDNKFVVECDSKPFSGIGTDLKATIKGSNGEIKYGTAPDKVSGSNSVMLDGITFNFNKVTKKDGVDTSVILTGKTDSKALKDKIVAFVNDYNKYIEKLNKTVTTKHDRSYNPLTAEQKKDMSENEVKLWNERVEKGQLYRDSDITRIASAMKDSMRTLMKDTGLNLEKVGIKPVKDYSGNLNGTFTIDEDKLSTALENNTEDVMKLFNNPIPNGKELKDLNSEEKDKVGILFKLKETIDIEFKRSTSSPLLKKAGFEGTTTSVTNELTKSLSNYEKKIKDMQKDFSRREQAMYSKFATLEKMMNKLNSQQSNLMSQLGMN
ncbi:flagellar filament capping protein FliD [Clostridium weizhouense]|uniref:Flagellar hook-associated protein 2 n=1 Tax=Clostridium weizhouense TaxID=2859781 RepID=A0ABS7AKF9_9CLOT|nr:flagellar filament capping protein FliD [Clostridium weizhouense]MBW6408583.1 flagellar filament capping protein FliD [Clostridium weizhouense]